MTRVALVGLGLALALVLAACAEGASSQNLDGRTITNNGTLAVRANLTSAPALGSVVNFGTFRGENAASVIAHIRVHDNVVLNGGIAAGFSEGGIGGRVGATFAW